MSGFILSDFDAYINLNHVSKIGPEVETAVSYKNGSYKRHTRIIYGPDGSKIGEILPSAPESTIVSLASIASNLWEILYTWTEDGEQPAYVSTPVVAFGLTVAGNIIPIGADDLFCHGPTRHSALRLVGHSAVYELDYDGMTHANAKAWMEVVQQRKRQTQRKPTSGEEA